MPLAWALVLLLGLSARRDWGCLQCDHSVREALKQLRLALIPSRFQQGQLQTRAQVVLRGMEGPFFRDYALNAFVGRVGACWGGERALDLGERAQWASRRLGGEATPSRGGGRGQARREMESSSLGFPRDPREFPPLSSSGKDHLDLVASFVKNQTSNLMANSLRGRS